MMKRIFKYIYIPSFLLMCLACNQDFSPNLPAFEELEYPEAKPLEADTLMGIWGGANRWGDTNQSFFEQAYQIAFQSVEDGEAVVSHWFTDAMTECRDSIMNMEYTYTFDGSSICLTPKSIEAANGARQLYAIHYGDNMLKLYVQTTTHIDSVCSLTRIGAPTPSITSVDKTLPQVGETIVISGRNLQFVDHVFLPTSGGEMEIKDFVPGSKEIRLTLPDADYAPGSIRCYSSSARQSCFTPAYMFRYDCVFLKNFSTAGTKAPYLGTEFEYSISSMGTIQSNAKNLSGSSLPAGHCLELFQNDFYQPDSLLTFFNNTPAALPLATGTDDKKGYIRLSSGDSFKRVLEQCVGDLDVATPAADAALQMDIFVYSDGLPEWKTGYLSWRFNKDTHSLTSSMVANVAMWDKETVCSFETGWKTFTIPLLSFPQASKSGFDTLGSITQTLLKSNLQTIVTFVNYTLDASHPAQALEKFQFNIANVRLVPYKTPENVEM